tara:strand:- start:3 stop:947 length:945 start_codon:yes stop_codon:yes gene_type:complete
MNILVVIEHSQSSIHRLSKEAIVGAQSLGDTVTALIIGTGSEESISFLKACDIEKVLIVDHELVKSYNADGYASIVSQVIETLSPNLIVAGHTYQTRDFMPRVSAKLRIPFIPDIVSMNNNKFVKQILNAKLNAEISPKSNQFILSFQSAAFSEDDLKLGSCGSEVYEPSLDSSVVRSKSEEPFQEDAGDIDLESAELLVSVGRGIEKEENVSLAFDLAKVIGAEVSASRPVVDSGWMDSFRQVGSSGSNVAPNLYLSLGISGAIQHVVGMKGAKSILAINKDPDAPIFEIADYAVIGDVLEIVPRLIEALDNS